MNVAPTAAAVAGLAHAVASAAAAAANFAAAKTQSMLTNRGYSKKRMDQHQQENSIYTN